MSTAATAVYIGHEALERLAQYGHERGFASFVIVADEHTYAALGSRAEAVMAAHGFSVQMIIVPGPEVASDERGLMYVLVRAPAGPACYLAAGGGTITDITRFVSRRLGQPFIALPSAPSVDGFVSSHATLTLGGLKQSLPSAPPIALFGDLGTLAAAPRPMIAAGLGDILGKFTSVADLQIGNLVWDERYDAGIGARLVALAQRCLAQGGRIAGADEGAVAVLLQALVDSGLLMAEFGNSSPASGSEHHISHCWEMRLIQQGRPAILHGAKVGVATVMSARWYAGLRALTQAEARSRLAAAHLPARSAEEEAIRQAYGPAGDEIIRLQAPFLDLTPGAFEALKDRVLERWDDLQTVAATVPPPDVITRALAAAGGPTDGHQLGLNPAEVQLAADNGHYNRYRFTIARLRLLLALPAAP